MKMKKGRKVLFWIFATALTMIMGAGLGILLQPATAMAEDTITYPAEGQIIGVVANSPLNIQCTTNSTEEVDWGIRGYNDIDLSTIGITGIDSNGKITGTPTSPGIYRISVSLLYPGRDNYVVPHSDFTLQVYPAGRIVAPATVVGEVGSTITINCSFESDSPTDSPTGSAYVFRVWSFEAEAPSGIEFVVYDSFFTTTATITCTPTAAGTATLDIYYGVPRDNPRLFHSRVNVTVNPAGSTGGNSGGNTAANATSKTTTTAAPAFTPEQQAQMWAEYQALLAQMKAAEAASAHHHDYEWVETKHATEDDAGEVEYRCKGCNDVLYRLPLSAFGVFNRNAVNKITRAGQNATVEITTARWISFHKSVFDALAARPDVTLTVNYLSEGYKGDPMTFTIPAGTDVSKLPDENGYAGFTFLGGIFGATPR